MEKYAHFCRPAIRFEAPFIQKTSAIALISSGSLITRASDTHVTAEIVGSEKPVLSNHRLYEGHDVDEAQQVLSRLFTEVDVEPLDSASPFEALVNGLKLPRVAVCYCEYRHGMAGAPAEPLDFHAIQLPLSGQTCFDIGKLSVAGDLGKGVMLSADERVAVQN